MRSKLLLSAMLATALAAPAAFAQATPPANPPAPAASVTAQNPQTMPAAAWRSSKLIGVKVYNAQNENVGDINELLLDQSGKVTGVIIGVGGFLGMGEHNVMVKMDDLKFVNEPVRTSSTTTSTTAPRPAGTATTGAAPNATATTTTTTTVASNGKKWYPDHAVLNATKEQLKAMPEFNY